MSIHDECTGYDFGAGHVTGIRGFSVDNLGRLRGVHHSRIWKPGENVAVCPNRDEPGRCGKDDSCGCGFWAFHDGSTYDSGQVQGVVKGYGKVTVGTKGFRAERAEVMALCLPGSLASTAPRHWSRDRLFRLYVAACVANIVAITVNAIKNPNEISVALGILAGVNVVALLGCAIGALVRALKVHDISIDARRAALYRGVPTFDADLAAKVQRNYPDVKVYSSIEAMKKAHPLDPALEPSPETDPTFWDDDVSPKFATGGLVRKADLAGFQQAMRRAAVQIDREAKRQGL